jgi:spore coat polysaccharide biosynthesis protein SpsF (cytidylyltransferase family)
VNIGIQARTTSKRFPKKVLKYFGDKCIVDHVIDSCRKANRYINRHTHRTGIKTQVHLLIPRGDDKLAVQRPGVNIIEGSEDDVLSRYVRMQQQHPADYTVRVTADCPLIKSSLVSKSIMIAVKGQYDFVSNAMPEYRTFFDGTDVEVISSKLLAWLDNTASDEEREHVMSKLSGNIPPWATMGHLFNQIDLSELKLSVDTEEDLKNVEKHFNSVEQKIKSWGDRHGHNSCHRF